MKHNKLLEVANIKTTRQCNAIAQFLKRNKQFQKKDIDHNGDQAIAMLKNIRDEPYQEFNVQNFTIKEEQSNRSKQGADQTQYEIENIHPNLDTEADQ